jgi:hypothetical protein
MRRRNRNAIWLLGAFWMLGCFGKGVSPNVKDGGTADADASSGAGLLDSGDKGSVAGAAGSVGGQGGTAMGGAAGGLVAAEGPLQTVAAWQQGQLYWAAEERARPE